MKPFYEEGGITVYNGDFLDGSRVVESESIQMVFADPPFNIGKRYGPAKDNRLDYFPWCRQWIDICFGKLLNTGSFYLMTISRHLPEMYPLMSGSGQFINEIHWRNVSAVNDKRSYWQSYQPILFYGKTEKYIYNYGVQKRQNLGRWTEWKSGRRGHILDYWDDIPFIYAGSVTHKEAILKPGTRQKVHPCQMPVALAERAILFSTNPGDMILDPFGGIGATAVAAKKTGRKCIIFEVYKPYCEIIVNRCRQAILAIEVPGGRLIKQTSMEL